MRVTKSADERKNEILDAAERLFATKGYDETSTSTILDEVGIARGTLYYHFKSKEDILDAVIMRMVCRMLEEARKAANDKSIGILERIPMTIKLLNADNRLGREVSSQMYKPQNALMHQKVNRLLIEGVVPIITDIVEEGIDAGIFKTNYARETVEMIMIYSNTVFDESEDVTQELHKRRMEGFIYNLERLLGTKRGFLRPTINAIFKD